MNTEFTKRIPASFRDLSGFVYYKDDVLLRQINSLAKSDYDGLMQSGLYDFLIAKKYLLSHQEVPLDKKHTPEAVAVIQPEFVPFISYPYEWSFSQLKDAALVTLDIQKASLEHGMSLKDASNFNIQFVDGVPKLIDTLSFEEYHDGSPWIAYRQFCQHFLAPLALMSLTDVRTQQLLRAFIDGIPLDLAGKLLPKKSYLSPGLMAHIHMHARMQQRYSKDFKITTKKVNKLSKAQLIILLDNLYAVIKKLKWQPAGTQWARYYSETNYSDTAFAEKHKFIEDSFKKISPTPKVIWDFGANNGEFCRFASHQNIFSVAMDIDPAAVEQNYRLSKSEQDSKMLPLVIDLTNPSPSLGWASEERDSLIKRGPADLVLALALIHHLSLSNHVPFYQLAQFFAQASEWLIVEFIPKSDSQVKKLMHNRQDNLDWYNQDEFEKEFSKLFSIIDKASIKDSDRIIYFMQKNK